MNEINAVLYCLYIYTYTSIGHTVALLCNNVLVFGQFVAFLKIYVNDKKKHN